MHCENGSPVKPGGQVQIGLWFLTWQTDPMPQVFGHGSAHLLLMQALSGAHSDETTHSGRHCGGDPIYPGAQEHTAWPALLRQLLDGPQGDGEHGLNCSVVRKISRHWKNGSPVRPGGHVHVGLCLDTWHIANSPQTPIHGLIHLYDTHAKRSSQSSFISHSRRQPRSLSYGCPSKPGKQ